MYKTLMKDADAAVENNVGHGKSGSQSLAW